MGFVIGRKKTIDDKKQVEQMNVIIWKTNDMLCIHACDVRKIRRGVRPLLSTPGAAL